MTKQSRQPMARSKGLIVRELDGEVLVYDRERDEASCLNQIVAKIWQKCDGAATPEAIAQMLDDENGIRVDERAVWMALDQLSKAQLLDAPVELPSEKEQTKTRREFLHRVGVTAAIAAPILLSIVVPTPAQAATCLVPGTPCSSSAQCCSGVCVGTCL